MPAGAWVIKGGDAEWKPAIDVTAIVLGAQLVGLSYLLFSWLKARAKARAQR
jgi:hypothetical protein